MKMETEHLQKLLQNLHEVPTEKCWNAIEQHLNVVLPTSGDGSNISQLSASKSNSLITKIIASPFKAAAITSSVIAVSTAAIFTINTLVKEPVNTNTPQIAKINDTIIAQTDTIIDDKPETISHKEQRREIVELQKPTPTNTIPTPQSDPIQLSSNTPKVVFTQPEQVNTPKPIPTTNVSVPPITYSSPEDPVIKDQDIPKSIAIKITIPNIFTPNGDGYNDFFVIDGLENCTEPKLYIKSTSGKLIYQSSNYQNDWEGKDVPDGVYLYYFVYKTNNIEEKVSGRVIIKR